MKKKILFLLIASGFSMLCNLQTECKPHKKKVKVIAPVAVPTNTAKEKNIFDVPLSNAPATLPPKVIKSKDTTNEYSKSIGRIKINFGTSRESNLSPAERANPVHDAKNH